MKKLFKTIFNSPWYFVPFAAYPVLVMLANNVTQVHFNVLWRPLAVSVGGALILFLVLRLILRDWHRAAFVLGFLLFLFFSYGHIYSFVKVWNIYGFTPGRHRVMLPLWLLLGALGFWVATRRSIRFDKIALPLNIITAALLVFPVYQTAAFTARLTEKSVPSIFAASPQASEVSTGQPLPDIYYIILDSYGRSDMLQEAYGYDNSSFISSLKQMGFYVTNCGQSNYTHTELSLASSLNMDYLQTISTDFNPDNNDHAPLWGLIKNSAVRQTLTKAGYSTVAFATGFSWTEITDANVYLKPVPLGIQMNEFEVLLFQSTIGRALQDLNIINADKTTADQSRQRTLLVLNSFGKLAQMAGPKFVFIHLIPPHPPFVFGPDGEHLGLEVYPSTGGQYAPDQYAEGYIGQVTYISQQIDLQMKKLIAESATPPIIIIQGDHGPWFQPNEKEVQILNAYYLPGHGNSLYPTITPVNTFRIILNDYLGMNFELLTDKSYYSSNARFYDFKLIPNLCTSP